MAPKKEVAPVKTYPVLSPILAGERYDIGETIDLTDKDAEELTACGAIGPAVEAKAE